MNREIGRHIRQLRTDNHITQDDLARQLHVTRQNISSWENGKSAVSVEYLSTLSRLFDVSIEELIYGPSPNRPYKKFQRKYLTCIGVCAVLLLLVVLSRFTLLPYIHKIQGTTFSSIYSVAYIVIQRIVSAALIGDLLCALISLWGDLRLRNPLKRILLIAGILLDLAVISLTILVIVLYCFPQSLLWNSPFCLLMYRSWLSSKLFQWALSFIGSVLIFSGCNR